MSIEDWKRRQKDESEIWEKLVRGKSLQVTSQGFYASKYTSSAELPATSRQTSIFADKIKSSNNKSIFKREHSLKYWRISLSRDMQFAMVQLTRAFSRVKATDWHENTLSCSLFITCTAVELDSRLFHALLPFPTAESSFWHAQSLQDIFFIKLLNETRKRMKQQISQSPFVIWGHKQTEKDEKLSGTSSN